MRICCYYGNKLIEICCKLHCYRDLQSAGIFDIYLTECVISNELCHTIKLKNINMQ